MEIGDEAKILAIDLAVREPGLGDLPNALTQRAPNGLQRRTAARRRIT